MSFSSEIRKTLCMGEFECGKCEFAELAGIISFSGEYNRDRMRIVTEKHYTADRILNDIFSCTGKNLEKNGERSIKIETEDREFLQILKAKINLADEKFVDKLTSDCCRRAFVRGAFLGGGCVANPNRNYHLEFDTKYKIGAERLHNVLGLLGISSKLTYRKGHYIVYLKGSDDIADVLGLMGAGMGAIELYNVQMEKDIRNTINRQINCETANQERVTIAASKHRNAIRKIKAAGKMEKLPDVLREIAVMREKYPELSLKDLGEMLNPPIGKSGANHRLNRLIEYANQL